MPSRSPVVQAIIRGSRARGIDPQAALAVARQEGLSGGIGDAGHAYGPFQLNNAGGVITGARPGTNDPSVQAWAMSPAGIGWALDRIAKVAGGLRGPAAVRNIVSRFERPADIPGEISRALAGYGGPVGSVGAPTVGASAAAAPTPPAAQGVDLRMLQAILNTRSAVGLDAPSPRLLQMLQSQPQVQPQVRPVQPALAQAPRGLPAAGSRQLAAVPAQIATRGGLSLDSAFLPTAEEIAGRFGVRVSSGYRSPAHNAEVGGAAHSDHLSGRAADFTGPVAQLLALYKYAQGRFPYVEPWAQAKDHVHISFSH